MRIFLLLLPLYLIAADADDSTPVPTESPAHMIEEGIVEALPQVLHIVSDCLGDHKEEAAVEIMEFVVDPRSPGRKIARGSILCCIRCCKKKHL